MRRLSFKIVLFLALTVASFGHSSLFAATNLSNNFLDTYNKQSAFNNKEIATLKNYDIYLIPGILAETLVKGDKRTYVKLNLILKDYYKTQLEILNNKYGIKAKRLVTSSYDINVTKQNIRQAVKTAAQNKRKVIFISHSLGGLVLIDELVHNSSIHPHIAGIAFLQSPFHGTELADLLLDPPWGLEAYIKKLLPVVNISERTIKYVGKERADFMKQNKEVIKSILKKIPSYTLSSTVKANKSIFKPAIDINESGCLKGLSDKCLTEVFYHGAYDKTDGLIPFKSSFIEGTDYVILQNVDHAELVLATPYETFKKEHITTTVLRVLLGKMGK